MFNQDAVTTPNDAEKSLGELLQLAYSGERAAGYAYRGHWKSVRAAEVRKRIREIEEEEWHHRHLVGDMLQELGLEPRRSREFRAIVVGRALGLACHLSGWLPAMYGAGRLESNNIREYETAARYALACGRIEWLDCLLTMAEVEWDHERYFRERVLEHGIGSRIPLWSEPRPRREIRDSFYDLPGAPERDAVASIQA